MPSNTAMEIFSAYKAKQQQNPSADQATLFKYILWDRFRNAMITDADIEQIARQARNLNELSYAVLSREKPAMAEGVLAKSARDAIKQFFSMNFPDGNR